MSRKEGYSAYAFEDIAADYLKDNPGIKEVLEGLSKDSAYAKDGKKQLDFVYRVSSYAEPGYMQYPVYRVK